ncbi:hypothetical protein CS0771_02090 [Catellatospora sp. IY07-71]|nr:hypothetical protein CS0771_02090 [Catellatospora sp. IY07-71]
MSPAASRSVCTQPGTVAGTRLTGTGVLRADTCQPWWSWTMLLDRDAIITI